MALAVLTGALGSKHVEVGRTYLGLAKHLFRQNRRVEADRALRSAEGIFSSQAGVEPPEISEVLALRAKLG